MSEKIHQVSAKGGRVWAIPKSDTVGSVVKQEMYQTFGQIIIILGLLLPVVLVFCFGFNSFSKMRETWDITHSFAKEYGYVKVVVDEESSSAKVVTLDGEEKTVDSINYKGATVLFENREQLDAKMTEVDSGTYPEELYLDK